MSMRNFQRQQRYSIAISINSWSVRTPYIPTSHIYRVSPLSLSIQKTYKYGRDLLSAAQRTRKTCKLDMQPNTALLGALDMAWERLSRGVMEGKGRLESAQHFHQLAQEVRGLLLHQFCLLVIHVHTCAVIVKSSVCS